MSLLILSVNDTENTVDDSDADAEDTGSTCPDNDKFCHFHDGLNWSDVSSDEMTWYDAVNYCKDLGGRLPAISELRTLIQNCHSTETGGGCGVTDSCLSYEDCYDESLCYSCKYDEANPGKYSVFGDTDWLWSSSEPSGYYASAWYVGFYFGNVNYDNEACAYYFRCMK
ncbi:MAG TPA: DUF1566 domain-containing protein [bacterium]|nr:DUF1566 domain-containing protein [bacterium]